MNRRKFLTISLLGLGTLLVPSEALAMKPSRTLRASAGQILALAPDGVHLEMRVNLGPQYTVLDLYEGWGSYVARVSFQGHIFFLKSTDGTTWYTYDWVAPSTRGNPTTEVTHG